MRVDVTFIGNATTLLRAGDFTLLTDPAFGPAGSRVPLGYGLWTRRVRDPALHRLDDVDLDVVLLSRRPAGCARRDPRAAAADRLIGV